MKLALLCSLAAASLITGCGSQTPIAVAATPPEPQRLQLEFRASHPAFGRGTSNAIDPISGTVAFALPDKTSQKTIVAFYRLADGTPIAHSTVPACAASSQPSNRIDWIGTSVSIVAEPEAHAFVVSCSREVDYAIATTLVSYDADSHALLAQRQITNQGYPTYVPNLLLLGGASTTDVIMNGTVALDPRSLAAVEMSGHGVFSAGGSQYVDRGNGDFANLGPEAIPGVDKVQLPYSGDRAFAVMPWLRETVYADGHDLRFAKIGGAEIRRTTLAGSSEYQIDVDDRTHETFALGVGTDDAGRRSPSEVDVIADDGHVVSTCRLPKGALVSGDRGPAVMDVDGTLVVAAIDRILVLDRSRRHVARTISLRTAGMGDAARTLPGRHAIARLSEDGETLVVPIGGGPAHRTTIDVPAFAS